MCCWAPWSNIHALDSQSSRSCQFPGPAWKLAHTELAEEAKAGWLQKTGWLKKPLAEEAKAGWPETEKGRQCGSQSNLAEKPREGWLKKPEQDGGKDKDGWLKKPLAEEAKKGWAERRRRAG